MNKTKLIIHERFNGNQSLEDVFLSAFQSESYQLLQDNSSVIMRSTEQSQDSFSSGKELKDGMNNEHIIYNAALYCRLSKNDEQAGESVSIGTQKMILEKFCKEQDFRVFDVYVDATDIIGLKQNPTNGRRFSPIFSFIGHLSERFDEMLLQK